MVTPKPLIFPPSQKLRRLPKVKDMTAILGFNCTDGVLLLADTEETTSSTTKSECSKLRHFNCPHGRVLLGGSGNPHYIEFAIHYLAKNFLQKPTTWPEIETHLNALGGEVFEHTLGQYRGFAAEIVPEGISLLIAVHANSDTFLFSWEDSSVVSVPPYNHASIGAGMIQTRLMIQDIQLSARASVMLLYALRVMRQTKRIVQGCGGKTEAIALHKDGTRGHFFTGVTTEIELLLESFEAYVNDELMLLVSGNYSKEETEKKVENIAGRILEFRRLYMP